MQLLPKIRAFFENCVFYFKSAAFTPVPGMGTEPGPEGITHVPEYML